MRQKARAVFCTMWQTEEEMGRKGEEQTIERHSQRAQGRKQKTKQQMRQGAESKTAEQTG